VETLKLPACVNRTPYAEAIARIIKTALQAVDPAKAVQCRLERKGNQLELGEMCYDLNELDRIYLVGAGKACDPMARAVSEILDDRLEHGIVIVKEGYLSPPERGKKSRIDFYEAGHPLPDQRGIKATQAIADLLDHIGRNDLVIFVISGGGSALLTSPVPGISMRSIYCASTWIR
jgi:glycerate 2-kinase